MVNSLAIQSEDTVTLSSYDTALANHNQPDKAFERFEKLLAIEPDDSMALNIKSLKRLRKTLD
ncbi:MAG: hypothetical protein DRR08_18035 [Candidatus Parabeggiatoa sp. nov. 2]|nr:MAG: hypothetical protein B6247_11210 [Beggiatoa sp. 4572_84]RKZ57817.1 MAG: hypothetical protein DRR08_18035 [Gammaproteobacteria bacterium]